MKNSKLIIAILVALLSVATTSAKVSKGKKLYLQKCKSCHGNGTRGAAMQTMDEWNDLFAEDAIEIKEKHEGTNAKKYFNSKIFKRNAPHLRDFLHEFGSDSGNVPSC
jgi:mono/diheme cytochrome c family protein